jgi:DNA uptake protein ComE-like DNA-binding protein
MTAPELANEKKLIDVNSATKEEIDALPEFLAKKIQGSNEYKARFVGPVDDINPDDIPF